MSLWDECAKTAPLDLKPFVRPAVEYFEGLMGASAKAADLSQPLFLYEFLRLAVPAAIVGSIHPGTLSLARAVAARVAHGENPTLAERSELEAAAFLHFTGVSSIEKVPEGPLKTPDFLTQWPHGTRVEVEVTSGETRPEFTALQDRLMHLSNAVHNVVPHRDTEVFVLASPSAHDEAAVLSEAIAGVGPAPISVKGKDWQIDLGPQLPSPPPQGEATYSITFEKVPEPEWYPAGGTLKAVSMGGGGAGKTRVHAPLPAVRYLNPLIRKVERNQSSRSQPFIVAVDVTRLPDAVKGYAASLGEYLPGWPQVSGVLVFSTSVAFWDIGWDYLFVPNVKAVRRLPDHIGRRMRTTRSQRTLHLRTQEGS